MEASLVSVFLSVLLFPLLVTAWSALNWVWFRPRKLERFLRQQGLSGNPYRFLSGDLRDSALMLSQAQSRPSSVSDDVKTRVLPFLHQVIKTHGKNSFMWVGPIPRVNIMEPSHLKDIFSKIHDYQKPDSNPLFRILLEGLVNHEGDKWSMHRKILNPAFHMGKLKLMLPAFHSSTNQLIHKWEEMLSFKESSEVDIWPDLQDLTRDVISQTAFGTSIEEGRKIFQLLEEQSELALIAVQSVYIPGWRFVPTKLNRRMRKIDIEIRSLIRDLVHRKEKAIKAGESVGDDLLGLMIESNLKEIQEQGQSGKKVGMSIDDVVEECKLFYFAGQETTSTLLLWTMLLLSIHPEWQQRAREEVVQVFGNSQPNFEQLNHLNVVTMILNEHGAKVILRKCRG
ncbi:hypothetical protein MLD38_035128 [Melastoma candidum]|uniref:Uncharacterized protein n=1 Tax=Melastoma candidum TaxID=119954 RepID=A0ACB9MFT3_9MYRT|nr:hypothetical protein MLD38_035128 [Melastoma candidum]